MLYAIKKVSNYNTNNVEAIAVLFHVGRFLRRQWSTPNRALVVRSAGWIWAVGLIGVEGGVTFDVNIAAGSLAAFRCTTESVVARKSVKAHVAGGSHGSVEVGEDEGVAVWNWRVGCHCLFVLGFTVILWASVGYEQQK